MEHIFHIGFLGYGRLTEVTQQLLQTLKWSDTEVHIYNCTTENLRITVEQAKREGCTVFVAGSGNAAEFRRLGLGQLEEIQIRDIDYLRAVHEATSLGRFPQLVVYKHVRFPDINLYRNLSGIPLVGSSYEDAQELEGILRQSTADVIIGASFAVEMATDLGKFAVLAYPGTGSIRTALKAARQLAKESYTEQRLQTIMNAIINNSTLGIMVCDERNTVLLYNQTAQQLTGFVRSEVHGRNADILFPTFKLERFRQSGHTQEEAFHLIGDAMYRCRLARIRLNKEMLGTLVTFYPDTRRRKSATSEVGEDYGVTGNFKDWRQCCSQSTLNDMAEQYAGTPANLVILGEEGTGRSWLAQCIHNASRRKQGPYVELNTAALGDQDAGRILFGREEGENSLIGILERAKGGTIVLEHLHLASAHTLACLQEVLESKRLLRLGRRDFIPVDLRFISLSTPEQWNSLPSGLRYQIGVQRLRIPSLRERPEDVPPLFKRMLVQQGEAGRLPSRLTPEMEQLLYFHCWPGNLYELAAVCQRYLARIHSETKPTPALRLRSLRDSIGEEDLFSSLLQHYPVLDAIRDGEECVEEKSTEPGWDFAEAVETAKTLLGYTNASLAEKLNLSRTTLWRRLNS